MQQRIEAIADGTQNGHGTRASADCVEPTRRKRPLIVAPPCQSEIKRTLRRARRQSKTVCSRGVHMPRTGLFGADGERRVSGTSPAWFRKGGRGRRPAFTENLHQSKIYTESNQSDFSQIFDDLTSMQTLAIYRRLLVKDQLRDDPQRKRKTRPGSRDVFSAPHGILARAGARAIAQRQDA